MVEESFSTVLWLARPTLVWCVTASARRLFLARSGSPSAAGRSPVTRRWRIVSGLTPGDAEPLVEKNYGDSFEDTTLEPVPLRLRVARLVVAGAQTDACIRSMLHGVFVRGYDATLVSDAHTTEDQTAWCCPARRRPARMGVRTAEQPRTGRQGRR